MLKWINVKELVRLDLDESKSLGIMRLDWSGSRIDGVCNQWYPSQQFDEVITKYDISIVYSILIINRDAFEKLTSLL